MKCGVMWLDDAAERAPPGPSGSSRGSRRSCPCRRSCSCRRRSPGPAGSSRRAASIDRCRMSSAARSKTHDRAGVGALGRGQLGVGVVDVVAGAVGEHGVDQVGLDLGGHRALGRHAPGVVARATRPRSPSRPRAPAVASVARQLVDVGVDQDRRRGDGVRLRRPPDDDPVLGLDPEDLPDRHRTTLSMAYAVPDEAAESAASATNVPGRTRTRRRQVLAGGDPLDGATALGLVVVGGHERAHVDDALALLARDLGPVVGVGRVGQVLVLLVLLVDRLDEVVGADAPCRRWR